MLGFLKLLLIEIQVSLLNLHEGLGVLLRILLKKEVFFIRVSLRDK